MVSEQVAQKETTTPIGGFARACQRAGNHGPFTVSPSDTAADRPVRIGQGGSAKVAQLTLQIAIHGSGLSPEIPPEVNPSSGPEQRIRGSPIYHRLSLRSVELLWTPV